MKNGTQVLIDDRYGVVYRHGDSHNPVVYFSDLTAIPLPNNATPREWELTALPYVNASNKQSANARLVVEHKYEGIVFKRGTLGNVVRDGGELVFIPLTAYLKIPCVHKCVQLTMSEDLQYRLQCGRSIDRVQLADSPYLIGENGTEEF